MGGGRRVKPFWLGRAPTRVRSRAAAVATASLWIACAHPHASNTDESPIAAPAPPQPPPPVDHLAPDELVEGTTHVFGLTLPRDLQLEKSFAWVAYASGDVGVHPLAKYFQARVEGGHIEENDSSAKLSHVRVRGQASHEYTIEIGRARHGSRIVLQDTTPPPMPDLPDEEARWRAVGLTPQGKMIDPEHDH